MKFVIWFVAGMLYLNSYPFAQRPGAVIDVERYIFEIDINDKNDSIKCTATIHFRLLQQTDTVFLDLISQKSDGRGMKVISVIENSNPLNYLHSNDIVRTRLRSTGKAGDKKMIQVQYRGIPADGLIISKNKYNRRTFSLITGLTVRGTGCPALIILQIKRPSNLRSQHPVITR